MKLSILYIINDFKVQVARENGVFLFCTKKIGLWKKVAK